MRSPITEPLHQLADAWVEITRAPRRRAAIAAAALACVLALLLARGGTLRSRFCAGAAAGASVLLAGSWEVMGRRRLLQPTRVLGGPARRVDPVRVDRALRALSLVGPAGEILDNGVSTDLARLHVARALSDIPSGPIIERGAHQAARVSAAAALVGLCFAGVVVTHPWSLLEGGDVLFARHGVAPVAMQWLEGIVLTARPPEYLHEGEIHEMAMTALILPFGTSITLRGQPVHSGRRLLLSDGTSEVPFVEDGAGGVVARWVLAQSTTLRVVARFGDVVIAESDTLDLVSLADEAPIVRLEGAPRQVRLVDEAEDIPIKYEASDDHGLREVQMILRSGTREERRILARFDGETTTDAGGRLLKLRDPFVKKSHAPIEVTVEAKDNDPLNGPKWGASPAITIIPPDVGQPEANRLEALRALRDALVDTLAWRLRSDVPKAGSARSEFLADDKKRTAEDEERVDGILSATYAGVRVPARTRATLLAQRMTTHKAVNAELAAPGAATHASVVAATERWVLVLDAIVRGLGVRDSRDAARQLADAADDLAAGADETQSAAQDARSRGVARMDAATLVLSAGGRALSKLGALGRDLGETIDADLPRVERGRSRSDLLHAELAARDLAARLRQPDPSFGSRGSGGRAGGESGGGRGTPGEDEQPSNDVEQAFDEAVNDLERLSQDHAGSIAKVEQALAAATSDEELNQMREEAKRHARAVREAVRDLPPVGFGSDSWTSKGAAARELAEQTARSLEQGRPEEAGESGRSALASLDEAKRLLRSQAGLDDPSGDGEKRVVDAHRKLDAEAKWIADVLRQLKQKAAERAHDQLEHGGEEEARLAERAHDLGQKGRDRGSLPQESIESIDDAEKAAHEAAQALKQGDADKGLARQREAQRDLEAAREHLQGEEEEDGQTGPPSPGDREGKQPEDGHVVKPSNHKGPEEFRRRVVRGLGQASSGSLKEAVRRYAEGLLR